jgi:Asp-tRNA(Asn)/Glu-tRNA(Gln) amidotransferase A subunit family amidase
MDEDLQWMPAWQLRDHMATRRISPVEVMQKLLERVDRFEPMLHPFITVVADQALDGARQAEQAIVSGAPLGPLHGVPVCIKDLFWTMGIRTTYGSKLFEDFVPDQDAIFAERLRDAGAIIFAKNNTPEFGMNSRSLNLVSHECLTPWDAGLERSSGGSSGGSGVSVAAGLGPISIGSDSGGSIRCPSSLNGVFGFMLSRGRVPIGPASYRTPMQCLGPMTRDVRDAAITSSVMAGADTRDWLSSQAAVPDYLVELDQGVSGLRLAWSPDLGHIKPSRPDAVEVAHQAAEGLVELGAKYDEPDLRLQDIHDPLEPEPRLLVGQAFYPRPDQSYHHLVDLLADVRNDPEKWAKLSLYVRDRTERPTQLEYAMAIPPRVRYRRVDDLDEVFSRYDILACPVIARPAFVAGDLNVSMWEYVEYTLIVNVAGYAAASVPAGFVDGLPVGLQLIAPPDREVLVLRAARALEQARPWAHYRPPIS